MKAKQLPVVVFGIIVAGVLAGFWVLSQRTTVHTDNAVAPAVAERTPAKPAAVPAIEGAEWRYFGGSKKFDRYSPLSIINKQNVGNLRVLWTRPAVDAAITNKLPDLSPSNYLRGTPNVIGGVAYVSDGVGLVEAFNPANGKTIWIQQPEEMTLKETAGQSERGVDYWESGDDKRIISVRGEYLYALNASDGTPVERFGTHGRVSLNRHTPDGAPYFGFNGPIVVGDVIVVGGEGGGKAGGGYADGGNTKEAQPEDIRGYDVRTGALVWAFHLMPPKGDPLRETWGKGSADYSGNMGAWAPLSADLDLGYVYVPLSTTTNAYYGGHRPGDNLYSNSLVALNAKTGEKVWYFQMVHHDLWDFDDASVPTLGEINVDGKVIKAVMQPNKSGFLYTFDRATGKPVWPIVERPVPQSTIPGEASSPTQPFPTKPPAFDRQGISEDDLIDFTPELHAEAKAILNKFNYGPAFMPPSLYKEGGKLGTLAMPGGWGAGNWNTGAFDPETGIYYAVSMTLPGPYAMAKPTEEGSTIAYEAAFKKLMEDGPPHSMYGFGPRGLPLLKPPYGRITALDMNKGEKLWTVANGDGPRDNPELKGLDLPPLGTIGRPVALVTKSLLFLGESSDAISGQVGVSGPSTFRAYDKTNGSVVSETKLPAGTTGGPITYAVDDNEQIILVPVGGKDFGAGWVALGIQ